jgi:V/A-type H+-transporting ATPase subunit C
VFQGDVQSYSVVHARVRARYAQLLSTRTWQELLGAQDLSALLETLAQTVYGPYLRIAELELTPRRAVYQTKWHLTDAFVTVMALTPEPAHGLLAQLWRLFEVDNLKAVLRGIETGASWRQVRFTLFPTGEHTVLPAEEMFAAGGVPQAVALLRHTPYFDTLDHALERYRTEQSLFPLEVALDLDYHRELWRDIGQLTGLDHEHALRLVGSMVDMNNLLWAIRYRIYHHLSEEEIVNYTLSFGYRVRDRDIRAIAAGASIAPIVGRIYPGIEDAQALLDTPRDGLMKLERQLQHRLARECHQTFLGYPFHVGIPLAYLLLNEQEIRDLTVLIEAKASRIPPDIYSPLLLATAQERT